MSIFKKNFLLGCILVLAFVIRIVAVYPGYPPTHTDEPLTYSKAIAIITSFNLDPHRYDYPIFPMQLHAVTYALFFLPSTILIKLATNPLVFVENLSTLNKYIVENIINPDALYWGRILTVILSVASIYCTFLLGKKIFNKTTGLIAAFLVSVNFRHVASSVLSLNDIPNALMTLISLILLTDLLGKQSRKRYLLLGIILGITLSVKYQTFILVPFAAAQVLIGLYSKGSIIKKIKNIFSKNLIYCIFFMGVTFAILNIFPLLHYQEWKFWLDQVAHRYGIGLMGLKTYPIWFLYTIGLGKILSFFVIIGMILSIFDKKLRKKILVLLSLLMFVSFFYFYYISGGIYIRNFTSIIPVLIIFGAYAIYLLTVKVFKYNRSVYYFIVILLITIIASYPSIKYSLYVSYFLSKETNNTCLQNWLKDSLPFNAKVGIIPPVLPTDALQLKKAEFMGLSPQSDYTISELQKKNIDYVIINASTSMVYLMKWFSQGAKYWDEPMDTLNNTFSGLSLRELAQYKVKECVKPWPVFDDNYIVVKIPKAISLDKMHIMETNSFKNWTLYPKNTQIRTFSQKVNSTCQNLCLQFNVKVPPGKDKTFPSYAAEKERLVYPPRLQSNPIAIKANKGYKIVAYIKSDKEIEEADKDGFIRLEFYDSKKGVIAEKPISISLSNRVWGNGWMEISADGVAPSNAKFLTISIQTEYYDNNFLINDIKVYESDEFFQLKNTFKESDLEILYPTFIL